MRLDGLNKADETLQLDDRCTDEFRNGPCFDEGTDPRVYQELFSQAPNTAIQEKQARSK